MQIKKKPTAVQGLDVHQMRRSCDALQYEARRGCPMGAATLRCAIREMALQAHDRNDSSR